MKKDEDELRDERRKSSLQKYEQLLQGDHSEEKVARAMSLAPQCVSREEDLVVHLMNILQKEGFAAIYAPYQADHQLDYMLTFSQVDCIMSTDTDLISRRSECLIVPASNFFTAESKAKILYTEELVKASNNMTSESLTEDDVLLYLFNHRDPSLHK
jgi:hypothetical protein